MTRMAVIGTGLVGTGWAIVFARAGYDVTLFDADSSKRDAAFRRVADILPELSQRGLIAEPVDRILARLTPCETLAAACDNAEYVQECGPERVDIKRDIYAALDACPPETILASSSSGITASQFAEHVPGRSRCIVAHPVNPPYLIPAVEIVPAPWTCPDVTERTRTLMEAVGQTPIILKREIDGFVLNRLQGALLHEAFRLVEDGVATPDDIDKTVRDGLGHRWSFMGPFETIDLNAPGGVADYVTRLGPLYLHLAEQRGTPRAWGDALVSAVTSDRRTRLRLDNLGERTIWRDKRLMDFLVHKKATGGMRTGSNAQNAKVGDR